MNKQIITILTFVVMVKRFDLYSLSADTKEDEAGIKAAAKGGNIVMDSMQWPA